jgi:hypothetical protein
LRLYRLAMDPPVRGVSTTDRFVSECLARDVLASALRERRRGGTR